MNLVAEMEVFISRKVCFHTLNLLLYHYCFRLDNCKTICMRVVYIFDSAANRKYFFKIYMDIQHVFMELLPKSCKEEF